MTKVITFILLACALATPAHAQEAKLRGFSVVLLLGEQTGSMIPPKGLSPSAQRAIADIKEFLPYKSYQVLDTQWVAGSEAGNSKGRIRGLEQKEFEFDLETWPEHLARKPGGANGPLARARFLLMTLPTGMLANGAPIGKVTMLDNSFAIKPGETVVVGTSRVQGDNALIVLLTAVTAGK